MTYNDRLTDEVLNELFERSKNDHAIIVGSEVRELVGEIRQTRGCIAGVRCAACGTGVVLHTCDNAGCGETWIGRHSAAALDKRHDEKRCPSGSCARCSVPAEPAKATHRCKTCGAHWALCGAVACGGGVMGPHWHLRSATCGPCCDNVAMGDQIEPLDDSCVYENPDAACPKCKAKIAMWLETMPPIPVCLNKCDLRQRDLPGWGWCPNTSLRIPKGDCGCCEDPDA
jgi:hypothetical protein